MKILTKIGILLITALISFNALPQETEEAISKEPFGSPELSSSTLADLRCLQLNIHFEARGETKLGKIAVANVTINRTMSGKFPTTICEVVYQKFQFSWVKTFPKHKNIEVSDEIKQIAYDSLISKTVKDVTKGALYFHNQTVEAFARRVTVRIGQHIFYK